MRQKHLDGPSRLAWAPCPTGPGVWRHRCMRECSGTSASTAGVGVAVGVDGLLEGQVSKMRMFSTSQQQID